MCIRDRPSPTMLKFSHDVQVHKVCHGPKYRDWAAHSNGCRKSQRNFQNSVFCPNGTSNYFRLQVWPQISTLCIQFATIRSVFVVLKQSMGHTGENKAKTAVSGPIEAKQKVEIWRRPKNSTFWPWFPIRSPIHQYIWRSISHRYWVLTGELCISPL